MLHAIDASSIRRALKLALHLLVLTMVRKSDLIESAWTEFDLDHARWTIPAARVNADRDRVVYLAHQAVSMLRELQRTNANRQFVFASVQGDDRPIAKSTLNQAVKALGLEVEHFVLHDFRRTASAHVRAAAQRDAVVDDASALDEERLGLHDPESEQRRVVQRWADFVDTQIDVARHTATGSA
jgi:integrase